MEEFFEAVDLRFSVFTFKLIALDHLELPLYKGSTFRGGMGWGMADLCQDKSKNFDCLTCSLTGKCPYAILFSNPNTQVQKMPLDAEHLPHPFVLRPPLTEQKFYNPGDTLECQLILFGSVVGYLPFYIYAFELFGEYGIGKGRGRFLLTEIRDAFSGKELYNNVDKSPSPDFAVMSFSRIRKMALPWRSSELILNFISPTQVIDDNETVRQISFVLLIRALLRRASLLSRLYEDKKWEMDFHGIIAQASEDVTNYTPRLVDASWERYSTTSGKRFPVDGIRGQIRYQGNFQPYLPLIRLGHYLHIGKKTTHGMGYYELLDS